MSPPSPNPLEQPFVAANWEVFRDALEPQQTVPRAKAWERAPVSASVSRLNGTKIYKKIGMPRTAENKENYDEAAKELEREGEGMRKRPRNGGAKEDISTPGFAVHNGDGMEGDLMALMSPRKNSGLGQLQYVPRKRTGANQVISPRKPLMPKGYGELMVLKSPVKGTPQKLSASPIRKRRSLRQPNRRRMSGESVTSEDISDKKVVEPVKMSARDVTDEADISMLSRPDVKVPLPSFETGFQREAIEAAEHASTSVADDVAGPESSPFVVDPLANFQAGESIEEETAPKPIVQKVALENEDVDQPETSSEQPSHPQLDSSAKRGLSIPVLEREEPTSLGSPIKTPKTPKSRKSSRRSTRQSSRLAQAGSTFTEATDQVQVSEAVIEGALDASADGGVSEAPMAVVQKGDLVVADPPKLQTLEQTILQSKGSMSQIKETDSLCLPRNLDTAIAVASENTHHDMVEGKDITTEPTRDERLAEQCLAESTSTATHASILVHLDEEESPIKSDDTIDRHVKSDDERVPKSRSIELSTTALHTEVAEAEGVSIRDEDLHTAGQAVNKKCSEAGPAPCPSADLVATTISHTTTLQLELSEIPTSIAEVQHTDLEPQSPSDIIMNDIQVDGHPPVLLNSPRARSSSPSADAASPFNRKHHDVSDLAEESDNSIEESETFEPISVQPLNSDALVAIVENDESSNSSDESGRALDDPFSSASTYNHDVDADMLRKFVTKVQANKAAKEKTSIPKRKRSLPHSPLQIPLGDVVPDPPSSPIASGPSEFFDLGPPREPVPGPSPTKRRRKQPLTADADDKTEMPAPPSIRRSGRTRLPVVKSTPKAPSHIPLRRQDDNPQVTLRKSAEKELANLTKINTLKNKAGAKGVEDVLKIQAEGGQLKQKGIKESFEKGKKKSKSKSVVWREDLVEFQEMKEKKVMKMKGIPVLASALSMPAMGSAMTNLFGNVKVDAEAKEEEVVEKVVEKVVETRKVGIPRKSKIAVPGGSIPKVLKKGRRKS